MDSVVEKAPALSLKEQAHACRGAFERCISDLEPSKKRWLELRLVDFMLWADGLGALASGRASLDNRLTDRPDLMNVIRAILEHLQNNIDDLREGGPGYRRTDSVRAEIVDKDYLGHTRKVPIIPKAAVEAGSISKSSVASSNSDESYSPWSGNSDVDGDDAPEGSDIFEHDTKSASLHIITADLTKLNRLSALIKRSAARIRFERIDQSLKLDEHQDLKNDVISSLTRRMLGPLAWYERLLKHYKQNPDVMTENSDSRAFYKKLSRVIDTWRCESLTESTTKVQDRLINAVLRRRHRINDARDRAMGSENRSDSTKYLSKQHGSTIDAAKEMGSFRPMPRNPSHVSGTNKDHPSVNRDRSSRTATVVGSQAQYRSIAPSRSERSGLSVTGIKVEFPRPRISEGVMSFRCPICSQVTERKESEEDRWRKHVKEDLQPYVCIYEDCPLPDRLFSSTEEWRKHIHMNHSTITWECSVCVQNPDHCQRFQSAAEMETHLRSAHLMTRVLTESQLTVAIDEGTRSAPFIVDICPICTTTESQLGEEGAGDILDHIASELLDLAFKAVVRNDDLYDSSGGSERANPQDNFSQRPQAESSSGSEMNERTSVSPSIEDDQTNAALKDIIIPLTTKNLKKHLNEQLPRYDSLENFLIELPLFSEDFDHHEVTESLITTSDATIRYRSSSSAIQRCLAWLYSPEPRRIGTRQVQERSDVFYISDQKLLAFMHSGDEVAALLRESSDTEAEAHIDLIRTVYPRVFTILLYIGHESLISRVCSSADFEDNRLPFGPDEIRILSSKDGFMEAFTQQQWMFCVPSFNEGIDAVFSPHSILPFTIDFPLGQGGSARVAHITLDDEYNKMNLMGFLMIEHSNLTPSPVWTWRCTNCTSGLRMSLKTTPTCNHCGMKVTESSQLFDRFGRIVNASEIIDKSKHVFALKKYRSQEASVFFENERAAFQILQTNTGPTRGVISYFGSFVYGDSFNNIFQYAEFGDLGHLMQSQTSPGKSEDILSLWRKVLELIHGLATVHSGNNVETSPGKFYRGWHFDIKPSNILVVKAIEKSPCPYNFKLAGFAWSHFKMFSVSTESTIEYDGTYAYGAPESRWYSSSGLGELRLVKQSVDIWSLGCVFSEAAIWIANGSTSVEEYREHRRHECGRRLHAKVGDLFHDGTEVLDSVRVAHAGTLHDIVSYGIIRYLVDDMLVPSELRPSAENLALRVDGIIEKATDDLIREKPKQANTQSSSGRRTSTSTRQNAAPSSVALQDSKMWRWDSVEQYRLDEEIIETFLLELFGHFNFSIARQQDTFRFWVPRELTSTEKEKLYDQRRRRY